MDKTNNMPSLRHGLTAEEVTASRTQHGSNRLSPPKRPSWWKLYLEKWKDPVIQILLLAALLSLGIGIVEGQYIETVGIMLAVFLATGVGFYFEYDAERKFAALNALGEESTVTVRRNGNIMLVAQNELVVGDVVLLNQGDEVPADGYLILSEELTVNESSLTGEASCRKSVDAPATGDATYAANRLMRSSMILTGNAEMVIDAVGDQTEIGRVAKWAAAESEVETPLNQQLKKLVNVINKVSLTIAVLVFVICTWVGISRHLDFIPSHGILWMDIAQIVLRNFMLAVTLIVMAVPEGLPMAVTLSLALNMRRMLKTNNLVRRMHACETMGAITVICTDKTGTLTENLMEVNECLIFAKDEECVTTNMAVNSTAHLEQVDKEHIRPIGNPTEAALLLYLHSKQLDYKILRKAYTIKEHLPFNTERKFMASLATDKNGKRILLVKGAPEVVLSLCDIDTEDKAKAEVSLAEWQQKAMRTLAFAQCSIDENNTSGIEDTLKEGKLQLTGICAINDPIREEVPAAVETCLNAGITVKIITGDTAGTAVEIAKRIGLWDENLTEEEQVIKGTDFAALSDEEALNRIAKLKIMSRARPLDKQRLVRLLQKCGEVVAVTGDGTNDAPALNFAQVGLSMGSGTAVAKEASDITLIDDSFGSIVTAVMWGRSLYKNIQRFVGYQLTISLTAMLITLAGSLLCDEMPLTVTQILWINLIIDTFASLALSTIPPTMRVMKDKPRKPSDFIINKSLLRNIIISTICFSILMLALMFRYDSTLITGIKDNISIHELTIIFTTFVLLQFWNLLNAKSWGSGRSAFHNIRGCKGLLFVLGIIAVCQILIVSFGGNIFRVEPLDFITWCILWAGTSFVLWGGEIARLKK